MMNVFDNVDRKNLEYIQSRVNSENVNTLEINGYSYLFFASLHGYLNICHYLIDIGADPSIPSFHYYWKGGLPLHVAAKECHVEVVRLLVGVYKEGVNVKSPTDRTPLMMVCCSYMGGTQKRIAICKILLDAGALFSGEELDFLTGDYEMHIGIYLLDRGARVSICRDPKRPEIEFLAKRKRCQRIITTWIWMFRKCVSPLLRVIGKDMVFLIAREVWRHRHTQEFYDLVGDLVE